MKPIALFVVLALTGCKQAPTATPDQRRCVDRCVADMAAGEPSDVCPECSHVSAAADYGPCVKNMGCTRRMVERCAQQCGASLPGE